MAKVVLENVYKSFRDRGGSSQDTMEPVTTEPLLSPTDTLPQLKSETRSPKSINVLRRINLTVKDGEFMVLVGPSGCGKSTLLRVIAGLEELTGGNIFVGSSLVNNLPPKQRDIAMVFQNYALYPHLSVYDNIAFGLRRMSKGEAAETETATPDNSNQIPPWVEDLLVGVTKKLPKGLRYISQKEKAVETIVREVAKLLQIEPLLGRLPKELSGGQKQRVALGRAIARKPQVFLMDEPLSNLDAKLRAETRSQIVKLQQQLGTTTIYVTHDQTEAMTMGSRIAVMNQGEIQQIATPLEIYNRPANRFVAEFIGSPPMNFIMVKVNAPLLISHAQFRLTLPEVWSTFLKPYDTRSLLLGIRPEHLQISPPATKNLPVKVELVEALGNETYLTVSLSGSIEPPLQVRIPPERIVKPGDSLWLSIQIDKIHLFDPQTGNAIGGLGSVNS
ncbi:MAG: ABC transporter ATP-binding protein [Oscillatoria sp. PMC 1051.18]|nr:ABC transporter ATP-binding protein [Oscillatoria sp. PMC 1050.18]MEC5028577.1 ABC transporter ATP-binding protein [Oscillatoria sp. PMC 1051.18]